MKRRYIVVFGVSNKHSNKEYSFFADYDNVKLGKAITRAKRAFKESKAPYACLVQSNPNRYHLYIPGFFSGEEVMRLFWFAKCDHWFSTFFMKHGRNVLRWTKKDKKERAPKLVKEFHNPLSSEAMPLELCLLLEELFKCKPPHKAFKARGSTEFSEYHMRPNGSKFYNKFLTSKGLNERVKEVLNLD